MASLLTPDPRLREFTDVGVVAPGALLHTYVSGTPATPLATYSDVDLAVGHANTNPVVASAGGLFGPIYLTPGVAYKFVLTDAAGNAIWTQDPVMVPSVSSVPASPADATQFLNGAAVPAFARVKGSDLLLADVVTNDVGIAMHGFAPKAPNDATKFLNGLGLYAVPSPGALTLLKQGSGTSVAAVPTTVDSIAIAGLTAKDTLLIVYEIESVTQDTALTYLYNVTDAVVLQTLCATGGVVTAGSTFFGSARILPRPGSTTLVVVKAEGWNTLVAAAIADGKRATFATAWTGAWTLGLRHNGVTAGGTFSYAWAVYKVAGQ